MNGLWLGLAAIASGEYNSIAGALWYTWYRVKYASTWEMISLNTLPPPLQKLLPYLKFVVSLIGVVTGAVLAAGVLPLSVAVYVGLAGSVAASVGVLLARNQAPSRLLGDKVADAFRDQVNGDIRARLDSLHGPKIEPVGRGGGGGGGGEVPWTDPIPASEPPPPPTSNPS